MTRSPPSLVSLTIESALTNLSDISDLSSIPDHILLDLFLKTLGAGKLTNKILKLFMATEREEILSIIQALNIKHIVTPVLPTTINRLIGMTPPSHRRKRGNEKPFPVPLTFERRPGGASDDEYDDHRRRRCFSSPFRNLDANI